jgi:hypothetical protein
MIADLDTLLTALILSFCVSQGCDLRRPVVDSVADETRLVGAFEVQGLSFTEPGFRGCAFVSASADAPPGGVVEQAAQDYRTWLHQLFYDLAQQAGAKDAKSLARQLVLLYDGAGISAWMDRDPSTETAARTIAAALVDAAIPA